MDSDLFPDIQPSRQHEDSKSAMRVIYNQNADRRLLQEFRDCQKERYISNRRNVRRYRFDRIEKSESLRFQSSTIRDALTISDSVLGTADATQIEDRLNLMINSTNDIPVPSQKRIPGTLYEPLHLGTQIRLLELKAGSFNDLLTFDFHVVDLSLTFPEYEAISYVWGETSFFREENERSKAICGPHTVYISRNLAMALRYLRYIDRSRLLWVDGLCINQDDKEERGHQVSLMSSVYSRARHVVVWLCDISNYLSDFRYSSSHRYCCVGKNGWECEPRECRDAQGKQFFETICMIVNSWLVQHHSRPCASYAIHSGVGQSQDLLQPQLQPDAFQKSLFDDSSKTGLRRCPPLDVMRDLYNLVWFQRTWAVQELVLARYALAKFGSVEIDWRWIGLAAAIIRNNELDKIQYRFSRGTHHAYLLFRLSKMSDLPPLRLSSLQLMQLTRGLRSTEIHDHIYGLLGITTTDNDPQGGNLLIRPDYKVDPGSLWRQLACKFIDLTGDLSILSSVQHSRDDIQMDAESAEPSLNSLIHEGTPSWVPRWHEVIRTGLLPWDSTETFSASRGIPFILKAPPGSGRLVMQGLRIGEIGSVHQRARSLVGSQTADFFNTKEGTETLYQTLCAGRNSYGSLTDAVPHDYMLSLFKVIYGDYPSQNEFQSDGYFGAYAESTGCLIPEGSNYYKLKGDAETTKYSALVDQLGTERMLCLTLNGFLVLAPNIAQEGDVLYVLAGSSIPMLLRPIERTKGAHLTIQLSDDADPICDHERFALVGECYAEGLMHGEAVTAFQDGTTILGPVPLDQVSNQVLTKPAQPLDPRVLRLLRQGYRPASGLYLRFSSTEAEDALNLLRDSQDPDSSNSSGIMSNRVREATNVELVSSLLKAQSETKDDDELVLATLEACRAAIQQAQQIRPRLDWIEIV